MDYGHGHQLLHTKNDESDDEENRKKKEKQGRKENVYVQNRECQARELILVHKQHEN